MELTQLRQFVCIVESGTMLKASELLYVSQPALSNSIKSLEIELGVDLFERRGKKLVLTNAGRSLYISAKEAIELLDTVKEDLKDSKYDTNDKV
ncbi:MAG: LysR family transcriptional regulator [Firmicutes bacterium]|nr:LysR family transcriptional regulator [Bacillota bacterium]